MSFDHADERAQIGTLLTKLFDSQSEFMQSHKMYRVSGPIRTGLVYFRVMLIPAAIFRFSLHKNALNTFIFRHSHSRLFSQ